ncbi:MAG: hypothetical protein K8U57_40345 [Planctomycetes bacterium]|nr:hypothetical protein [Planctomycetota bacterium]
MPSADPVAEFRADWLPHVTDEGLDRLVELLQKGSPLLIHGAFTRAVPMGCLASHVAWNHPHTCRLSHEAGVIWLTKIAGLNPATSAVIQAWDEGGLGDFELRSGLLTACLEDRERRTVEELEPAAC